MSRIEGVGGVRSDPYSHHETSHLGIFLFYNPASQI